LWLGEQGILIEHLGDIRAEILTSVLAGMRFGNLDFG
jgi:hypothetical protein